MSKYVDDINQGSPCKMSMFERFFDSLGRNGCALFVFFCGGVLLKLDYVSFPFFGIFMFYYSISLMATELQVHSRNFDRKLDELKCDLESKIDESRWKLQDQITDPHCTCKND